MGAIDPHKRSDSRRARFFFDVTNLPLERDLASHGFVISALPDPKGLAKSLAETDATHVTTGHGHYDLSIEAPGPGEDVNPFIRAADTQFGRAADALTILLSFASRRSVQFLDPHLYVEVSDDEPPVPPHLVVESDAVVWRYFGGTSLRGVFPGRAYGHPWYFTQDELEGFLDRNFDRLLRESDESSADESAGLRLAMHHLNASRVDDWLEWKFEKAWTALEGLIGRSPESRKRLPLPQEQFRKVREKIKEAINTLPDEIRPGRSERDAMSAKIGELNREAIIPSAMRFFKRVFAEHEYQEVTEADLRTFLAIRNSITHTGIMDLDALKLPVGFPYDYGTVLPHEHERLDSLVERVVLALLGERPHLMDVPWQDWRNG
ncbi:MAG TPA: hypothetical protein VFB58_05425 [Chloroflexota bacterium]|nr:hypothetical protein [Chloroflexota bacterium]